MFLALPRCSMPARRVSPCAAGVVLGLLLLAAAPASRGAPPFRIGVVAAENVWGDIVEQLAGDRVAITSILSNPAVDPHEYETNARDAAAVARARLVIANGLGYDTFIDRLVAASPNPARRLIVVAHLTARRPGDNPHLWYDPTTMPRVAQALAEALAQLDPGGAPFYRERYRAFQASLRPVARAIAALRAQYAGVPVAATEPVFNYMAEAIGLAVRTPVAFQKAIEAGVDPPAAAVAQMEDQLRLRQVRVLVYNTQTVSPVTARARGLAARAGIPVVGVSETEPPGTTYQRWMLEQLRALRRALEPGRRG